VNTILIRVSLAGLIGSALGAQTNSHAQIPVRYTVTDLGLIGNAPGQPIVIKNNGLVAGGAGVSSSAWNAMLWYGNAKINIGTPGLGGSSTAYGANERGQVVGEATTKSFDPAKEDFCGFGDQHVCQPFLWEFGLTTALPLLKDPSGAPGRNGVANSINNRGAIVGAAENTTLDSTCPAAGPIGTSQKFQFKPVMWRGGAITELSTVGGDPDGIAFVVNDKGQVAGSTGTCTTFQANGDLTYLFGKHAVIWEDGVVTDLGNLGSVASGGGNAGLNINNRGQVVGISGTTDGGFHAFLWSKETGILDVGAVGDDISSVALAINDKGDITGISFDADFNQRAFLRPDGGVPVDLNSLVTNNSGLYLVDACSINASGQIIGIAIDQSGNAHGYLATPQ
jgi:probable HAF family extracellular repeat protein